MKKILLTLTSVLALSGAYAQTDENTKDVNANASDYNRWSIEVAGGVNKFQRPASADHYQTTPSFYNADLGVRYMFNNKIGLKLDVGYYNLTERSGSMPFESHYYRTNLQAVANLGRIMNFETFTSRLGLLAHAGFGYAQLKTENRDFTDRMLNFMAGVTGQVRLGNKFALTGDFSTILNARQNITWDGQNDANVGRGFQGILFHGTVGLTYYLGGNEKHADWIIMDSVLQKEIANLENRLATIEAGLTDSDQDGVPDMFDAEPNSITGVAVDSKGRTIDKNGNGIADELESYFDKKYSTATASTSSNTGAEVKSLINDGYVNVYFDFNSTSPTSESVSGINFLVKYLKANPSASADVMGYADEIGNSDYNQSLSKKRAENVKQILVDSGIEASRLNIVANGEDTSVNKSSKEARQIVRRVTFMIK